MINSAPTYTNMPKAHINENAVTKDGRTNLHRKPQTFKKTNNPCLILLRLLFGQIFFVEKHGSCVYYNGSLA